MIAVVVLVTVLWQGSWDKPSVSASLTANYTECQKLENSFISAVESYNAGEDGPDEPQFYWRGEASCTPYVQPTGKAL